MERKHQLAFIDLLKQAVPPHLNLAEEIAAILDISSDSVYRRLRTETDFSLEEVMKLVEELNVSLSDLMATRTNTVAFRVNNLNGESHSFTSYLKTLYGDLQWINQWEQPEIIYAAEDLPVFYHFFFPNLLKFKMIYWNKSILGSTELQSLNVEEVNLPSTWLSEVPKVRDEFLRTPSLEIWNEDTIKSNLKQIEYYWNAGYFQHKETVLGLLDDLTQLVELVKMQAANGKKFDPIHQKYSDAEFTLYACDVMIGNNCVFLQSKGQRASYIGHNSFNFIQTKNNQFNEQSHDWLTNLISKSELVSRVSERRRNQYFKVLFDQIQSLRDFVG
jgi:DNA-binding phage protein